MTRLNSIEVPSHYNGVGLHDTPGSETAAWDYNQSAGHARELRAHGVTLYKLFGSGTKGNRAAAYADNGIVVLHRWWPGGAHWGRPPADWLMPRTDYDYLLGSGVALFEPGWNEFNISEEWATPIPGAAGIARAVVDAWEVAGDRYGGFEHLLFPSNTPGGNVDHRACYRAIVAELASRGLVGTVKHVAIHPRPLNNPPWVTWTSTNTCTFDEWRWIRDQFRSVSVNAYYWATEHGYSVGYNQNTNYPPMNLQTWTDYNWDLFVRLNPAQQSAIEPGLAGVMYWFNAGWGHWGPWPEDALVDSPAPEMPAPSPLWIKMGNLAGALAFSRYEGVEPPPPPERARGIDVSYWQCEDKAPIDWQAVANSGVEFAIIRASIGDTIDKYWEVNYQGARAAGLLVGAYHYLHPTAGSQAGTFAKAVAGKVLKLGCWADIEADDLTADKCTNFFKYADPQIEQPINIYTNASKFNKYGTPAWALGRLLWVADWRDVSTPALPDAWSEWEFWQTTSDGAVPGIVGRVDLDVYAGTPEQLHSVYGNGEEPIMDCKVFGLDDQGNHEEKSWQWAVDRYGVRLVEATPPKGATVYRLTELRQKVGPCGLVVKVVDEEGSPLEGIAVIQGWANPDKPLPADAAPRLSEDVWAQPEGKPNQGTGGTTNSEGDHGWGWGSGEQYDPTGEWDPDKTEGAHWYWVMPGDFKWYSDVPLSFGWLLGTDHDHLDITFTRTLGDDDPVKPPPVGELEQEVARCADALERIADKLEAGFALTLE